MDKNKRKSYNEIKQSDIDAPTLERFKKSNFSYKKVEKNGRKVVVDVTPTPLHRAFKRGKLTSKQFDAGIWFEFSYELVWGNETSSRRDPLDMTPRGNVLFTDPTTRYIHYKDVLSKVEARLKLETLEEHKIRNRVLTPSRRALKPLLKVGKWGDQRYRVVRSVCYNGDGIGDCHRTRRRYKLLCEGLDIIHDVVF